MNLFKIFFGIKSWSRTTISARTEGGIKKEWENIEILLKGKVPSQLRQAIIIADKTLDFALKDIIPGETMGDRLKNAKDRFDGVTYDKIWKAHKIRNALVHDTGYEPPHYILIEAVENIRTGLRKLNIFV